MLIRVKIGRAGAADDYVAENIEDEVMPAKKGLYANINAKRKRGAKMRKKGEKGAPTDKDFKNAAKTAKRKK